MKTMQKQGKKDKIVYSLRPSKPGQATFSDVRLPDGTIIRRVDESVHQRALENAARAFRKQG